MVSHKRKARAICALDALKKLKALRDESASVQQKKKHRYWVSPFLLERSDLDLECHLLKDVVFEDGTENNNSFRMDINKFEYLLSKVERKIRKCTTSMRYPIPARTRFAITLRFLVTGDSYRMLESLGRVSRKTMSSFIPEVLEAIIESLQDTHLKMPTSENEWEEISKEFERLWQFPHTLGVINCKHFRIKAADASGSGCQSIAILALVDAHCRFIYIDLGLNPSSSDVTVYNRSSLYKSLRFGTLNIPKDKSLMGQLAKTPYYFVGDELFGLDRHLLNEYNKNEGLTASQKVFNYKMRRARMAGELAFKRLASQFHIFHRTLEVSTDKTEKLVRACCVLHNFLSDTLENTLDLDETLFDINNLPETIKPLTVRQTNDSMHGKFVRENVCKYVFSDCNEPV